MKRKKKIKHKVLNFFIVILILIIIGYVVNIEYRENEFTDKQNKYKSQKLIYNNIDYIYNQKVNNEVGENKGEKLIDVNLIKQNNCNKVNINQINLSQYYYKEGNGKSNLENAEKSISRNKIIEKYKGYDVSAKLIIPTIKLETYVLKNFSLDALNVSVTKFWGPDANEVRKLLCGWT